MNTNDSMLARLSVYFIENYRITVLAIIVLLLFGGFTYTSLIRREGFPSINVPVLAIQTPYFVNDSAQVESAVTDSIASALSNTEDIKQVSTTSTENFSVVVIEFNEGTDVKASQKEIQTLLTSVDLPLEAEPSVVAFDASKINGEYDMMLSVAAELSYAELEQNAARVADTLSALPEVGKVDVISVIDPVQTTFNRAGFTQDGELVFAPAINIGITKKNSTVEITDLSHAVRDTMTRVYGDSSFQVNYSGDFALVLEEQLASLEENAIVAIITIFVVLFFFINWRSAMVLGFFIPLTMAAVFIALYLIGFSLNTISLFSLILVLGLFVDDGTIVVEAIDYHKKQGLKGIAAVSAAIKDIGVADISGTLTTLLVFLPLVFVSGILGEFIRLLPITVILALALSLVIALTIIPKLANLLIADEKPKSTKRTSQFLDTLLYGFTRGVQAVAVKLSGYTAWYLAKSWRGAVVIAATIAIVLLGSSSASSLGFAIFPASKDSNTINASLSFSPGTTLAQAQKLTMEFETKLQEQVQSEIVTVDYISADQRGVTMEIELSSYQDREVTSIELAEQVNTMIYSVPSLRGRAVSQGVGPGSAEYPFAMQVFADDTEQLATIADELTEMLQSQELSKGVTVIETAVSGLREIQRIDNRRYIEIKAKFSAEGTSGVILELKEKVLATYTPEKLTQLGLETNSLGFDLGQESDNQSSFDSTLFAAAAAIFIMYGLLVVQFNSFLQPLLVLLAIPLSFPGLFVGLNLTDNPFSFFVMIGVTGLTGIVVNNSIMLITYANSHRATMNARDAIVEAIRLRFRPVATTSATTVAGLLPLALTDPFWEPLAFTIIFGLISSTVLVLLAFPAFYTLFEYVRELKYKLVPAAKTLDVE